MPAQEHKLRVAYLDEMFIGSDAARPLRILAEYLEPLDAFRREQIKDTIVFFGSARLRENGPLGRYYQEARSLARLITEWSMSLSSATGRFVVCSGGGGGIMEAANLGAYFSNYLTSDLDAALALLAKMPKTEAVAAVMMCLLTMPSCYLQTQS